MDVGREGYSGGGDGLKKGSWKKALSTEKFKEW